MAKLRISDGYTPIHHELLERVFCRVNFPSYEIRIIFAIMRMSWGWQQRGCYTSYRELADKTGIDLRHIGRTVKALIDKQILEVRNGKEKTYLAVNTDYMTWQIPEAETLFTPCRGNTSGNTPTPVEATPPLPVQGVSPYISASGCKKAEEHKQADLKKGEIDERNDLLFEMRSFRRSLEQKA